MDGWMMDGWMGGWMDGQLCVGVSAVGWMGHSPEMSSTP